MTDKLKPCPFCGGEAFTFTMQQLKGIGCDSMTSVVCKKCHAASNHFMDDDKAIEAWNRRVDSEQR